MICAHESSHPSDPSMKWSEGPLIRLLVCSLSFHRILFFSGESEGWSELSDGRDHRYYNPTILVNSQWALPPQSAAAPFFVSWLTPVRGWHFKVIPPTNSINCLWPDFPPLWMISVIILGNWKVRSQLLGPFLVSWTAFYFYFFKIVLCVPLVAWNFLPLNWWPSSHGIVNSPPCKWRPSWRISKTIINSQPTHVSTATIITLFFRPSQPWFQFPPRPQLRPLSARVLFLFEGFRALVWVWKSVWHLRTQGNDPSSWWMNFCLRWFLVGEHQSTCGARHVLYRWSGFDLSIFSHSNFSSSEFYNFFPAMSCSPRMEVGIFWTLVISLE